MSRSSAKMLCSGCHYALWLTPTMKSEWVTFDTSYNRLQLASANENCFICSAICRACKDPDSKSRPILENAEHARQSDIKPWTVTVRYLVKLGDRTDENGFQGTSPPLLRPLDYH